jgi:hypothetical protein
VNDALQFRISPHSDITGDHPDDVLRLHSACQDDHNVTGDSKGPICLDDEDVVRAAIQDYVGIDGNASVLLDDILRLHATRQDHLRVHGLRENSGTLEDEDIVRATLKDDVIGNQNGSREGVDTGRQSRVRSLHVEDRNGESSRNGATI